ncbi:MAG: FeoB-associated Cys-rich membrane protein [Ignavibacteria bacterium]|nr:FeoB-associated Cys-rich membrane protein [Ignavibacteria bacterium]
MRKFFVVLFFLICSTSKIFANAAAPGFYNNGGSSDFIPFFASDSLYLDKLQMQSEQITVLLYPNFAVVRGEYNMLNLSNKEIIFNTGYPINASYENELVSRVSFEDIYGLKVFVDGTEVPNEKLKAGDSSYSFDENKRNLYNNWYVWKSNFKPGAITKIKVYFIVNTSNSILRKGYSKDTDNGFVYILESGKAWAKNIESGRINIQLMDGLTAKDIMGVSPNSKFTINDEGNSLIYDFKNLEPTPKDNVLIRYKSEKEKSDIQSIVSDATKYYDEIDRIQPANIFAESYKSFSANDFEVHDSGFNVFAYMMIFLVFGVPIIIFLAIAGIVIFIIVRRRKRKKQSLTP